MPFFDRIISTISTVSIPLILMLGAGHCSSADSRASEYRVGSGDLINIMVFGEPDLSMDVRLGGTGTFNYPFLGELSATGNSVNAIKDRIYAGLKGDYLVEPEVSVTVKEYRPFFMNGEVKKPGSFTYSQGMTVRKAIALAGGFTERASRKKIYLVREDGPAAGERRAVEIDEEVRPGDAVTVDQSFF